MGNKRQVETPTRNKPDHVQNSENLTGAEQGSRRAFWVILVLVGLAFSASTYLGWAAWKGGGIAGCGPDSPCDQVLSSRWAYLGPLPVSWGAVLVDALWMLGLLKLTSGSQSLVSRKLVLACATLVSLSALWFIGLQVIVIKAICPYCMSAHVFGLTASVLTFGKLFRIVPRPMILVGSCLLLAAGLGVAQVYVPHTSQYASVVPQLAQPPATPSVERVLSLYNGAFKLKPSELPMMGATNAKYLIVSLFDYSCHHCRQMHGFLKQQLTNYAGQFGVINLPMPLDGACNWIVKQTPKAHVNSCSYAQIGLAVFLAAPHQSHEFDEWLWTGENPPPIDQVRRRASELLGAERLQRTLTNEWIKLRIQEDISLYASNYAKVRKGQMPQLIIGDLVSVGVINQQSAFDEMITQQWGITNRLTQVRSP